MFKILAINAAILSIFLITVESRGNINWGSSFGSQLIYHEIHEKYGVPLMKRDEEVTIQGVENELIHAVMVHDLKGDGVSYVTEGGVGAKNVTIRLESGVRGNGYKFLVDVFAL